MVGDLYGRCSENHGGGQSGNNGAWSEVCKTVKVKDGSTGRKGNFMQSDKCISIGNIHVLVLSW
jgi:hypothetical protein